VSSNPDENDGGRLQGVQICPTSNKHCNVNNIAHTDALLEVFSPGSTKNIGQRL